jgi:hypothetical protein
VRRERCGVKGQCNEVDSGSGNTLGSLTIDLIWMQRPADVDEGLLLTNVRST